MKKGKAKSLTLFLVICLVLAALITTFIAVNRGTGGFMTRAAEKSKFNCSLLNSRESLCKTKSLCEWKKTGPKTGFCASKLTVPSSTCATSGDKCCTNATTGQGYCDSTKKLKCNPTSYTCVESSQNNLGQERGEKGTCSLRFKGASCMWKSNCAKQTPIGIPTLGYCKGPMEWQCCVPVN